MEDVKETGRRRWAVAAIALCELVIGLEALRHAPGFEFWIVLGAVVALLVLQAVEINRSGKSA